MSIYSSASLLYKSKYHRIKGKSNNFFFSRRLYTVVSLCCQNIPPLKAANEHQAQTEEHGQEYQCDHGLNIRDARESILLSMAILTNNIFSLSSRPMSGRATLLEKNSSSIEYNLSPLNLYIFPDLWYILSEMIRM